MPLVERVALGFRDGSIRHGALWGEGENWEPALRAAHASFREKYQTDLVRRFERALKLEGYHDIVSRPGFALATLAYILGADKGIVTELITVSPEIQQLIRFCQAPVAARNFVLSTTPSFTSETSSSSFSSNQGRSILYGLVHC